MNRLLIVMLLTITPTLLAGCGSRDSTGPPLVRLGDSVCDRCYMILSDERWATATVVEGPRRSEPRLFDDFNCQVHYEAEHPDETVLHRWSHSHTTRNWIRTEEARFLISPSLRTPMASSVAAFESLSEAEAASAEHRGRIVTFEAAWKHLHSTEACCSSETTKGPDSRNVPNATSSETTR